MALIFSATTLEISHDTLPQRAPGATCCQLSRLCFHQCLSGYLRSELLLGCNAAPLCSDAATTRGVLSCLIIRLGGS